MPETNTNTTTKGTLATLRAVVPDRRLNATELSTVTERQATLLRRLFDNADAKLDLDHIARIPRVELIERPDLLASATAFWRDSTWLILVNTTETITRQRFSICHELHHIICHATRQQMFGTPEVRNPEAERLADYFAACLLMPRLLVKRYWGTGPRKISVMAERFGVSPQAMSYRLDQLGLTEPRPRCAWTTTPALDEIALEAA